MENDEHEFCHNQPGNGGHGRSRTCISSLPVKHSTVELSAQLRIQAISHFPCVIRRSSAIHRIECEWHLHMMGFGPIRTIWVECALKLVGEDGIEPSPSDFQSVVHTKYTILPLKLVAVLRVSTPLSPQRAMHQLIMSGNPFYARARINYLSIKPFG